MVKKQLSLKQLQRAVADERSKAKSIQERRDLEVELSQLRSSRSNQLLKSSRTH